jgi:CRISPR/Cas system-associated exonuclease Cas4 (RecB family)
VTLPALVGDIVHGSLDVILHALHERGCASIADTSAVEAMRELGGYTSLIDRLLEKQLERLDANPRMATRVSSLRSALRARVPEIRRRVQAMVSRATLKPHSSLAPAEIASAALRAPLGDGSHPEVTLQVHDLRLTGRADLITIADGACEIVDYKTGAPDEHHAAQLRMYALLWSRDSELNPEGLPVASLTLAYPTHDETVAPLTSSELEALAQELAGRITASEHELGLRPPPARPSAEICGFCDVRHLCEAYWKSSARTEVSTSDFVDEQGAIVGQNGPRSWLIELGPDSKRVLLRTPTEQPGFKVGDNVRLLDVAVARDGDSDDAAITITQASEVFLLQTV